tara:strand:+ start:745 stop:942 length:198 start_codon:yes stop_codon:yes gene_type:complete
MTNTVGQTTLGFSKVDVWILLDALDAQETVNMTEDGYQARIKLMKRLIRARDRLETNDRYWPWVE